MACLRLPLPSACKVTSVLSVTLLSFKRHAVQRSKTSQKLLQAITMEADNQDR